ncbi:MAG: GIY-YIG nuclease family protein [Planctomycetota bacterium]
MTRPRPRNSSPQKPRPECFRGRGRGRLPRHTVYLLLAREDGTIYTGYTANLRRRFAEHNAPGNRGFTKGRTWHLLACRHFLDADTALLLERQLKRSKYDKRNWIKRLGRLATLCERHGIQYLYLC